jgi:hypothetical protein
MLNISLQRQLRKDGYMKNSKNYNIGAARNNFSLNTGQASKMVQLWHNRRVTALTGTAAHFR